MYILNILYYTIYTSLHIHRIETIPVFFSLTLWTDKLCPHKGFTVLRRSICCSFMSATAKECVEVLLEDGYSFVLISLDLALPTSIPAGFTPAGIPSTIAPSGIPATWTCRPATGTGMIPIPLETESFAKGSRLIDMKAALPMEGSLEQCVSQAYVMHFVKPFAHCSPNC